MGISGDSVLEAIQNLTLENQALRAEIAANRKTVEEAEAIIEAAIPPVSQLVLASEEDPCEMRTIVKAVWPREPFQVSIDPFVVAQAGPGIAGKVARRITQDIAAAIYSKCGLRR